MSIILMMNVNVSIAQLDTKNQLRYIIDELKDMHTYSFDYTIKGEFPNGETDEMTGNVAFDEKSQLMYNDCKAYTILKESTWYYIADHLHKTIQIINLTKNKRKNDYFKKLFDKQSIGQIFDTVIMKIASIKSAKENEDTLSAKIVFPAGSVLKEMNVVYNKKKHLLVSYSAYSFIPERRSNDQSVKSTKGTKRTVICNNYFKSINVSKYSSKNYFIVSKGKVVLKKSKQYKVNSIL